MRLNSKKLEETKKWRLASLAASGGGGGGGSAAQGGRVPNPTPIGDAMLKTMEEETWKCWDNRRSSSFEKERQWMEKLKK